MTTEPYTHIITKEEMRDANLKIRRAEVLLAAEELADMFYHAARNYQSLKASLVVELTPSSAGLFDFRCKIDKVA